MIQFLCQPTWDRPQVLMTPEVKVKLAAFVDSIGTECAMEGTVEKHDNVYVITDVFVYPQIVQAAHVTTNDEAYALWTNTLTDEQINTKRFQVHSHVNMSVSPSAVDLQTYSNYIEQVDDFMIFMIINKRGDYSLWLYDKENNMIIDKADILFDTYCAEGIVSDWCSTQVDTFVKTIYSVQTTKVKPTKKEAFEDELDKYLATHSGY